MNKNIEIQSLRGFAITITLIDHFGHIHTVFDPLFSYFWLGGGVDLFFAISGFVIARGLFASDNRNFASFIIPFWKRRVARLWPAMFFWSAITLLLSLVFNVSGALSTFPKNVSAVTAAATHVMNFQMVSCHWFCFTEPTDSPLRIYWSLSLEEQFYLLFPVMLFLLGTRRIARVALVIVVAQIFLHRPWPSPLWFFRTDALALGVLVAWVHHHGYAGAYQPVFLATKWRAYLCSAFLLTFMIVVARVEVVWFYNGLVALLSAALVYIASFDRSYLFPAGWLKSAFAWIGERSYSLYLVHATCFVMVREIAYRIGSPASKWPLAAIFLGLVLTFIFAEASFRLIEAPLRNRGREWAKISKDPRGKPRGI